MRALWRCDLERITIDSIEDFLKPPPIGKWLYGSGYDMIKDYLPYAYFETRYEAEIALKISIGQRIGELETKLQDALNGHRDRITLRD